MTPLAWLLGLLLPACGAPGAQGLPVPPVMDTAHIVRPNSPNTALAAPAGFTPTPDILTQTYNVPPSRLFAAIEAVAAAQPRTYLAAAYPDRLQVHWVVRSAALNFPDQVTAQVTAAPVSTAPVSAAPVSTAPVSTAQVSAAHDTAAQDAGAQASAPNATPTPVTGATAGDADAASLVLYSRSVYGYGDFGANRRRVAAWLAALDRTLNPASER